MTSPTIKVKSFRAEIQLTNFLFNEPIPVTRCSSCRRLHVLEPSLTRFVHLNQFPAGVDQGYNIQTGLVVFGCTRFILGARRCEAKHLHFLSKIEDSCLPVVSSAEVILASKMSKMIKKLMKGFNLTFHEPNSQLLRE